MRFELSDAQTINIHRKLVIAALREVIGVTKILGRSTEDVVDKYYGSLPPRVQLLVAHDDPLGLAFKIAEAESPLKVRAKCDYRGLFDRVRKRILDESIPQKVAR
jgi:hypothetical protein